jgi:flagellar biogenesis protein FliO
LRSHTLKFADGKGLASTNKGREGHSVGDTSSKTVLLVEVKDKVLVVGEKLESVDLTNLYQPCSKYSS